MCTAPSVVVQRSKLQQLRTELDARLGFLHWSSEITAMPGYIVMEC